MIHLYKDHYDKLYPNDDFKQKIVANITQNEFYSGKALRQRLARTLNNMGYLFTLKRFIICSLEEIDNLFIKI